MRLLNRIEFANSIYERLLDEKTNLKVQFDLSNDAIGYFFIDDVLPVEFANEFYNAFPSSSEMVHKKNRAEDKYVAAQMNVYNSILEEIVYAFQDERIVRLIGEICSVAEALPDENLYAGGISMMGNKQFLNPHLDNSHDKDRGLWRVLNLLYYVTPNWKLEYGGNLELWPEGLKKDQITIHSKFNRLVVMATHHNSIHSVSPVIYEGNRCCVSNYYFSKTPLLTSDSFHVTSFRGRPDEFFKDVVLQLDNWIRMGVRKVFKNGIKENPHVYKKDR